MKHAKRKLSCDSGVAAIEFALLAPAAILLIVLVLEISMMFLAQSALDKGAAAGARMLRTGQVQLSGMDINTLFREKTCGVGSRRLKWLNCSADLQVFAEPFADLRDVVVPEFEEGGAGMAVAGDPGDFMVVRLYYPWRFLTPPVSRLVAASGGSVILSAGAAFRVENYNE
jgi:hypothetical protein